jgi:hypothetical protein
MQNLPIYLYQNIYDVVLDLDSTVRGVNQVMYQRNLVIQKGLKNQVRIQFKNSDQKKIRVYNTQTYVFSMFDAISKRLLLEKPLEILDVNTTSTKGLGLLTLNESDTLDLPNSNYNFSIKLLHTDGSYVPTYSNTYYGVSGTLELTDDVMPIPKDIIEVSTFNKVFNGDTNLYEHFSGSIYANPEFNGNSGLHTLAIYLTAFRGTVYIQSTLDNNPGVGTSWTTEYSKVFSQFTGIEYVNLNGVFSFLRIKFIPAKAPAGLDNDDPSYFGSFDKVLYRS